MPIRPIGGPINIMTNPDTSEQPTKKTPISKGIADTPDSFERLQSGPVVGTLIGSAIGHATNNGEEDATKKSTSKNSHTQMLEPPMQANNANEQALEGAEKQKELLEKQKKPRRQTYSITPPDSD